MAGQWGYYAVHTANQQAGVVVVPANKTPTTIGGSKVDSYMYLGDSNTPAATMTGYLQKFASQHAQGLFEYSGGFDQVMKDATSRLGAAQKTGKPGAVVWMKTTPSGTVFDNVLNGVAQVVVATTLGPVVSALDPGIAKTLGANFAQTGNAFTSAASDAAKAIGGFGSGIVNFALRILEMLAGAALIALALQALTGTGSEGSPVAAVKSAAKYVR